MTSFTVNGEPVHYRLDPATPLLWALRDASNLTGTRNGCGVGQCGACTVHVDGQARLACQVAIGSIEGTFVTTIEGLSGDRSHPLQQAWVAEGATACGFCVPGFVMAAAALLQHTPQPSDEQVEQALGNLCRCGTYPRIRRAVARAVAATHGGEAITAAPPPHIRPADAATAVPALTPGAR